MNLAFKEGEGDDYNGYIQGPDGIWYTLYDYEQLNEAYYGGYEEEDYDYDYEGDYYEED